MLKLFQSIFGTNETHGHYPESLVEMAIERAVDGTDPRLRATPGYRRHLRAPVIHAIDHVVALVNTLPAPLAAGRGDYSADPRLMALFASADSMLEVFANDPALREFGRSHAGGSERVTALLLAERVEKHVLGMELAGEMLRRDVAQVAVNFGSYRLLDPAASEEQTRRQLMRRAFDHLLTLALTRITEVKGERADLARHRDLLRRKLSALQRSGWSFEYQPAAPQDPANLASELDEIETRLKGLGGDAKALQTHMDIVAELLSQAERQLWGETIALNLDRMNIQREAHDPSARQIVLQELHNARGARLVLLLISLLPSEMPQREDFFAAAQRYLG